MALATAFILSTVAALYNSTANSVIDRQNVVIIGASSGIGREMAMIYAARKLNLILVSRRKPLLDELVQKCNALGASATAFSADITNQTDMDDLAQFCLENLGKCDTLVISSGILSILPFAQVTSQVTRSLFETNTFGPISAAKAFIPLIASSKGRLVVISSAAGVLAAPTVFCF